MSFDPCNRFLKIRESIGTPIPKVWTHLGVWGFIPLHSSTLPGAWNVTFASLCLGHEPKARVVTGKVLWMGCWGIKSCFFYALDSFIGIIVA
jgi:hypothetical protein